MNIFEALGTSQKKAHSLVAVLEQLLIAISMRGLCRFRQELVDTVSIDIDHGELAFGEAHPFIVSPLIAVRELREEGPVCLMGICRRLFGGSLLGCGLLRCF